MKTNDNTPQQFTADSNDPIPTANFPGIHEIRSTVFQSFCLSQFVQISLVQSWQIMYGNQIHFIQIQLDTNDIKGTNYEVPYIKNAHNLPFFSLYSDLCKTDPHTEDLATYYLYFSFKHHICNMNINSNYYIYGQFDKRK